MCSQGSPCILVYKLPFYCVCGRTDGDQCRLHLPSCQALGQMQSCADVALLVCPHVQGTEVSWSTEKVSVPSTGRQWSCPFIWFLCLFLSSIIHHCSTVTALAIALTKMLFNRSMWDLSFGVFIQRGAGSFGFDMAVHFPGVIYTNYTSFQGDITNQQ